MTKKIIVITGSTKGIGHGLALEFLKRDHQVIFNGRNEEGIKKTVEELESQGYDVLGVAGDVSKEDSFQSIVDEAMVRTDFLTESSSRGDAAEQVRNQKVFDILAEDVEVVTEFLVKKIMRLMFVR